ncbi:cobyrinate a,c-diamide synthase [Thiohalomonas denitrificans]|uniref:Cobyrinate a,c-diamide synthase n=1 Tax=Thiohalomonas denitrificans TaxID=415747 RepID=A0A1G5QDN7_9GAMM|nr:cobyrinate a,c-diamide synthase [Thiohalomonas denitrificans]SCZ59807.1 cobyrinic acid a,c-diamide synthase [Thiohalomonas denitrificans]
MAHLLIGAPSKSSGKTTLTLGLCAALARRGLVVQPFKKGPDYIDPMWLGRAAGRPCYTLDFNTMDRKEILGTFRSYSEPATISLVEGNMGLYDSLDVAGAHSNAALAALLGAPVLLVVNVKGATRSIVPLIRGFLEFEPKVHFAGILLNNVAGDRHEKRLREVIGHYLDIPVVGAVHRDPALAIDERHLGLVPSNEASTADRILARIADRVEQQVDLGLLLALAEQGTLPPGPVLPRPGIPKPDVRIGVAKDGAFGFYYPRDLERLREAGAALVPFSPVRDSVLPQVDGLFIGGGFPETHLAELSANQSMRDAIRDAIEADMPVYAECGGLMYLCRSIRWRGEAAEMAGVMPADAVMHEKPVGRGYVRLQTTGRERWPNAPAALHAHEFHYSSLENLAPGLTYAYEVTRGAGIDGHHDGFVYRNLLANYVHLQDVEEHHWTRRFVDFIRGVKTKRETTENTE